MPTSPAPAANSRPFPVSGRSSTALLLFAIALAVRLAFLPFTLNNGTDAWARYQWSLEWLQHLGRPPTDVWLPFHFWLLGAALMLWRSEWAPRLLTLLLGAATIPLFWGIVRRLFDRRIAFYSALFLALFGFHVGYSLTTTSEVPNLFCLVLGLYAWVRFRSGDGWHWLVPGALAFSAACLTRFESWLFIPLLTLFLFDWSEGLRSAWGNRRAWGQAIAFAASASLGAVGWMIYSTLTWGNPFAAAARTVQMQEHLYANLRPPLWYRVAVVPGALAISLNPLVWLLGLLGVVLVLGRRRLLPAAPAVLLLVLWGTHWVNSVSQSLTMSRYTLNYSWLFVPYAFLAVAWIGEHWRRSARLNLFAVTIVASVLWQAGIVVGSYYGPPASVDRLSSISPTLPLPVEVRHITAWLRQHRAPGDVVLVDEYHDWANDIIRFSGISFSDIYRVPYPVRPAVLEQAVRTFLRSRRPALLVYSPSGGLRRIWPLPPEPDVELPRWGIRLHRVFQSENFRIYQIAYLP